MSLEPGPHSTAIWCAFGGCSSIRHGSLRFSLVLILSRPSSSSGHGHMVSRCHQHSSPLCVVAKQMGQRLQSMKATLHFSEETLKSWIGILNSLDIFFLVFRHLSFLYFFPGVQIPGVQISFMTHDANTIYWFYRILWLHLIIKRASSKSWLLKEAFKIKYSLPLNLQRPRHMYNERSGAALCLMAEDFRSGSEKWMMLISIRDPGHRKYVRSCANRFSAWLSSGPPATALAARRPTGGQPPVPAPMEAAAVARPPMGGRGRADRKQIRSR